jgi:hypothetical protein
MLSYAFKRIIRSWKLYASLILGMMLAATFFGGINVGADTIGKQALDAQLTTLRSTSHSTQYPAEYQFPAHLSTASPKESKE